jgi:hypothetical protein
MALVGQAPCPLKLWIIPPGTYLPLGLCQHFAVGTSTGTGGPLTFHWPGSLKSYSLNLFPRQLKPAHTRPKPWTRKRQEEPSPALRPRSASAAAQIVTGGSAARGEQTSRNGPSHGPPASGDESRPEGAPSAGAAWRKPAAGRPACGRSIGSASGPDRTRVSA